MRFISYSILLNIEFLFKNYAFDEHKNGISTTKHCVLYDSQNEPLLN